MELGCGHVLLSWWILNRQTSFFLELHKPLNEVVDIGFMDVCVYVQDKSFDMNMMRNEFMKYIAGQSNIQCYIHKYHLIVNKGQRHEVLSKCW